MENSVHPYSVITESYEGRHDHAPRVVVRLHLQVIDIEAHRQYIAITITNDMLHPFPDNMLL
jgi:hypothetical protein